MSSATLSDTRTQLVEHFDRGELVVERPVLLRDERGLYLTHLRLSSPAAIDDESVTVISGGPDVPFAATSRIYGSAPAGLSLTLGAESLELAADTGELDLDVLTLPLVAPLEAVHATGALVTLSRYATITFARHSTRGLHLAERTALSATHPRAGSVVRALRSGAPAGFTGFRSGDVLTVAGLGRRTYQATLHENANGWVVAVGDA